MSHDQEKIDFINKFIMFLTNSKYLVIVPPARHVGSGHKVRHKSTHLFCLNCGGQNKLNV